MIQITDKSKCCGCTACDNVCPQNAISMLPDEEGFLYPHVCLSDCVDCGLCEKACPVLHAERRQEKTEGYIIRNRDAKILEESTSGGAFTAFAAYLMLSGSEKAIKDGAKSSFHRDTMPGVWASQLSGRDG